MTRPSVTTVLLLFPLLAAGEHLELPELQVGGVQDTLSATGVDYLMLNDPAVDSAELLGRIPGAAANGNGPLTGIAQYRGMYGDRVNILLNGTHVSPAGPNTMDPPLSRLPVALMEQLSVVRGIAPVSSGNETIGGTFKARTRGGQFGSGEKYEFHGDAGLQGHTVDGGYDLSLLASLGNQSQRFHIAATRQEGDDYDAGTGTVRPSEHERNFYTAGYGWTSGDHEFSLDVDHDDTNANGTPALPMDIEWVDGNHLRARYQGRLKGVELEWRLYGGSARHRMSNYHLRQAPVLISGMAMRRHSLTESRDLGYALSARWPVAGGQLMIGADGYRAEHFADIFDPGNPRFLINNFRGIDRDVDGLFGEWTGELVPGWSLEAGLRYTHVHMNADTVSATGFPMAMLQNAADTLASGFNSSDRSINDGNIDAVLKLRHAFSENFELEFGLARKTRSPSYQERYLWLPAQSTAGLADGNNYIGDIGLDPEVSWQAEIGLEWQGNDYYFTPRLFYHHVRDYITGVAGPTSGSAWMFHNTLNAMLGSSALLLQFANVDARLYGIDAGFGWRFLPHWRVDGNLSAVRGERVDSDDNLYRIAAPTLLAGVSYDAPRWSATLEGQFTSPKRDIAEVNNERKSAGYILFNLRGEYHLPLEHLLLRFGAENLLDKQYRPHTAGLNRVASSAAPAGVHVPGPGRNIYASLSYEW